MGEANEKRVRSSREISGAFNLSLAIDKYPRDLLQRFMTVSTDQSRNTTPRDEEEDENENEGEIELNLGLSLGGRFGVDKNRKKIMRSSSIAGTTMSIFREDDPMTSPVVQYPILVRASSVPTETEEEWRKRKEMQTLRRMQAKRRRSEKQKNSSSNVKAESSLEEESLRQKVSNNTVVSFGLRNWAGVASRQACLGSGKVGVGVLKQQSSQQGSVESQGGCSSSSMSELEALQGSSSCEARSPASTHSFQEAKGVVVSVTKTNESATKSSKPENSSAAAAADPSKKPDFVENKRKVTTTTLENMPCVFTKAEGPNGRRVDGILYKYGKGEEVRIMCVCHGIFLSPAEFVRHAGGGDVDHPLRHIVVNSSSSASF